MGMEDNPLGDDDATVPSERLEPVEIAYPSPARRDEGQFIVDIDTQVTPLPTRGEASLKEELREKSKELKSHMQGFVRDTKSKYRRRTKRGSGQDTELSTVVDMTGWLEEGCIEPRQALAHSALPEDDNEDEDDDDDVEERTSLDVQEHMDEDSDSDGGWNSQVGMGKRVSVAPVWDSRKKRRGVSTRTPQHTRGDYDLGISGSYNRHSGNSALRYGDTSTQVGLCRQILKPTSVLE